MTFFLRIKLRSNIFFHHWLLMYIKSIIYERLFLIGNLTNIEIAKHNVIQIYSPHNFRL